MELYQLRTFLTVADEGHLTRAAEKLFTSQPAVSTQVRALEDELGVKLFERSSRGMTLTAAGFALQEQARKIVNAARDCMFRSMTDPMSARTMIRIALTTTAPPSSSLASSS